MRRSTQRASRRAFTAREARCDQRDDRLLAYDIVQRIARDVRMRTIVRQRERERAPKRSEDVWSVWRGK
jgi:hypothetical protein